MHPVRDKLFDWILTNAPNAKYNLTSSGLPEPDLNTMGIDTSFEKFAAVKEDHEAVFRAEVAGLYGVEPANVVITNGSSEAIFLTYLAFGGKGAAIPLPNYPALFTTPRTLGIRVGSSPTRGGILAFTDPNNPTGKILDSGAVDDLVESAKGGTVYINETYGEFKFEGKPRTHFGQSRNLVTSSTMTKFFGLGRLRVGWIFADEQKARQLLYAKWAVSGHDSEYSLWLATQVLQKRKAFVERARAIYSRNVPIIRKFLGEYDGRTSNVGEAPFCLVRYKSRTTSTRFVSELLGKKGVLVSPGDYFGAPNAFRLCFTTDERTLRNGLAEISNFVMRE